MSRQFVLAVEAYYRLFTFFSFFRSLPYFSWLVAVIFFFLFLFLSIFFMWCVNVFLQLFSLFSEPQAGLGTGPFGIM